jgi:hypothetical protein
MKKIIIVLMLLALSVGMVGCGGGGSGSSSNPSGEKKGVPSVVQLLSTHSIAQTNSTVYLHTKVLDGNGVPVRNEAVTYTNLSEPFGVIKSVLNFLGIQKPLGVLSATVVRTNNLGIATVKLTSTTAGFATIQAEVNTGAGQVRDKRTIFFTTSLTPPTPPSPTIRLHVYDSTNDIPDEIDDFNLFKGGNASDNRRSIKAVVKDGFGRPISGATVFFGSDSPANVTFSGNLPLTNENGEAVVVVEVTPFAADQDFQLILNITAQTTVGSTFIGNMVSLFLHPGPVFVSSVTVNANPSVVTTNGTSAIVASVALNTGAVPDNESITVNFSATCNGTPYVIQPFAQTINSMANVTFTAPSTPGTCTITATAGGVSGSRDVTVVTSTLLIIPAAQTLSDPLVGDTATYSVLGGVGPYTAISSAPGLVSVPAGTFTGPEFIATVVNVPSSDTTVTITVYDSRAVNAQASLVLDVGPPVALSVNPVSIALTGFTNPDSNEADDVTFYIQGGVPPYYMYSNNDAIIMSQGLLAGNNFTIDPEAVSSSGSVTLTIEDSLGATVTSTVTVTPALSSMGVNPSSISVVHPTVVPFHILGGLPDYTIFPSNLNVVDIGGNPFVTTPPFFAATTNCLGNVILQIVDADGRTVTASMTVTGPALSVLPSSQTIINPTAGVDSVVYAINGGISPYGAFSSHPGLVSVGVVGSTLTATVVGVPASDTTVTIAVADDCGSAVNVSLVLDVPPPPEPPPPPAALAIIPSPVIVAENINHQVLLFQVTGGNPIYTIVSTNSNLAFNDDGAGGGTADDGVRNGAEGGIWSVPADGGAFEVTIPAGDIVAANTDVSLLVTDSGAQNTSATITIQEAIP